MTRDVEAIRFAYGDPIETVISGLRHAIISNPDRDLCIGDLKTIEARIVLALAGQYDKVKLIADGKDIYIDMAQTIYKRPIDKHKNPIERTIGKQTVLGAGFGMGAEKFQKNYAQGESLEFCKDVITAYRTEFAPEVPKLWYGLEEAACRTAWDRVPHEAYGVRFAIEDLWLTARLPSGRKLYYFDPQPMKRAMPWDETDIRPGWTFRAQKLGRWRIIDAYGGQITENVVSGLARDILVAGLFRCERNNLPVILTVHDETITEPLTRHSNRALLEQLMSERDKWAVDLQIPVGADTWCGDHRYRK
jgi:DNA polymerase